MIKFQYKFKSKVDIVMIIVLLCHLNASLLLSDHKLF